MATKTKKDWRKWAKQRCEAWNWNANIAEIAHELIGLDMESDSDEFAIVGEEFVKFFGQHDKNAKTYWEIVGQIIEQFS
jgi:hypothetical protein